MSPADRDKAYARINDALIQKYGIVELSGEQVTDYHTQALKVPAALFKRLNELEKSKPRSAAQPGEGGPTPMMNVLVNVDSTSPQQMLGVARRDFYLLAGQRSFAVNFLKGIIGMWCTHMMVLAVAVACSTYLTGVISLLCTLFLFGAGLFTDYIQPLGRGQGSRRRPARIGISADESFAPGGAHRSVLPPPTSSPAPMKSIAGGCAASSMCSRMCRATIYTNTWPTASTYPGTTCCWWTIFCRSSAIFYPGRSWPFT